MTTIAAFQKIDEDRYSQKIQERGSAYPAGRCPVFSLNMDLLKVWGANHKLNYGIGVQPQPGGFKCLVRKHQPPGTQRPAQTRYPGGGSQTLECLSLCQLQMDPE